LHVGGDLDSLRPRKASVFRRVLLLVLRVESGPMSEFRRAWDNPFLDGELRRVVNAAVLSDGGRREAGLLTVGA